MNKKIEETTIDSNRKNEHIKYSLQYKSSYNSFDDIELIHNSIPKYNLDEISLETMFSERKFEYPFFINAMTGGSKIAKEINKKLGEVASKTGLLFVTGSYSAALKDSNDNSYKILRKKYPNILLATNIGIDKDYTVGQKAIDDLNPIFLQIHVNLMQELIMQEGSRNFNLWYDNLVGFCKNIKIPLILKEVGFGMDTNTIKTGIELGIKTFDISGRGGTSFSYIENMRKNKETYGYKSVKNDFSYLDEWGQTTVVALLNAKQYMDRAEIIASGGVRNPLDIIKALVLGARGVGISRVMLELVQKYSTEEVIEIVNSWKEQCKIIMCALNSKNIEELKNVQYILYGKSREYIFGR